MTDAVATSISRLVFGLRNNFGVSRGPSRPNQAPQGLWRSPAAAGAAAAGAAQQHV